MSQFRSRLARYNTVCCEQVMPVPVTPVCTLSGHLPKPICEFKEPTAASTTIQCAAPTQVKSPLQIPNYYPGILEPPTGNILTSSFATVPAGYLAADGSEVSRTTYADLFRVIGTTYGDGNGSTTFNLPNLSYDDPNCVVSYIIKT
jgi:hypothetical protein